MEYIHHIRTLDQADESVPLRINCADSNRISHPFVTNGSRLDWYLFLMTEGEIESSQGTLVKGSFIIWPPRENHSYSLKPNETMSYCWAHFTGSFAEKLLSINGIEPGRIYKVEEESLPTFKREWDKLLSEAMLRRSCHDLMEASILQAIIVRLGREIGRNTPEAAESKLRKRLERSAKFIHSNYTGNISVQTLSEMEHISPSRYRELFKSAFCLSPSDYIIRLRIERAEELLLTTDSAVADIAAAVGYGDELYFSRLFKKKTGLSPLAFRREGKASNT